MPVTAIPSQSSRLLAEHPLVCHPDPPPHDRSHRATKNPARASERTTGPPQPHVCPPLASAHSACIVYPDGFDVNSRFHDYSGVVSLGLTRERQPPTSPTDAGDAAGDGLCGT